MHQAIEQIRAIGETEAPLAEMLTQLARQFQFEKILNLIELSRRSS